MSLSPVILSRRTFSGLAAVIGATLSRGSVASGVDVASHRYLDLTYAGGSLTWPGGEARAACGKGGVRADKREGDGASPAGTFPLVSGFYRPDRVRVPHTDLPMVAMQPNHGWVDDPADPNYNRLVEFPYPGHHEDMWLADHLYDIVVVIGYNIDPIVAGAGSAIFLHIARPDFSPTAGCIATTRNTLEPLLGLLGPGSTITIRA